ncbi:MAG: hypothetical protein PHX65_06540 [Sulfurimonas sp.]|jgi:predicted membrane channel-forming protein YqfA (hemolysin III family)|nr:hypothetical protein [Sulfurimonas sp.]
MKDLWEYFLITIRLLYDSFIYFLFSYITIFISILTIKLVDNGKIENVLHKPEIISAFLATIPTYLIGIHYMTNDEKKDLKFILLILIVISIALFGIIFNVKVIKDMETVEYLTYTMLLISLLFTFLSKVNFKDFKSDIKTQRKADQSRERKEVVFPNGKTISI